MRKTLRAVPVAQAIAVFAISAFLLGERVPELSPSSVVRGRVLSGVDSSPSGWALVFLEDGDRRLSQSTDTTGRFLFSSVSAGRYLLTVRALGYHPFRDSILVIGDTLTLSVVLPAHCEFDSLAALRDIARDSVRVLLHGGIAPLVMGSMDAIVERRYRFRYMEFGDMVTQPPECDKQYHRVVFRFLDAQFGKRWRDSVRVP